MKYMYMKSGNISILIFENIGKSNFDCQNGEFLDVRNF